MLLQFQLPFFPTPPHPHFFFIFVLLSTCLFFSFVLCVCVCVWHVVNHGYSYSYSVAYFVHFEIVLVAQFRYFLVLWQRVTNCMFSSICTVWYVLMHFVKRFEFFFFFHLFRGNFVKFYLIHTNGVPSFWIGFQFVSGFLLTFSFIVKIFFISFHSLY